MAENLNDVNDAARGGPRKTYGESPDVRFDFPNDGGASVFAEKYMLARASEVFRAQLPESRNEEIDEKITITDISFDKFDSIVKIIYNEKTDLRVCERNYQELLYAARKYMIYPAIQKIVDFLLTFIKYSNLAEHFEFLDKFEIQPLKEHMTDICGQNPLEVLKTLGNSNTDKRILQAILESPRLTCDEFQLYTEVKKMLIRSDKGNFDSSEFMRKELGKLMYLIRFPTMTKDQLIECSIAPCPLTDKELKDLLQWVNHKVYSETLLFFPLKTRTCTPKIVKKRTNNGNMSSYCETCRRFC